MSIEQNLDRDLKDAMRAKEQAKVACIRQVRAKAQAAMNEPNFKGPPDDAFYGRMIAGYIKSLEKGIAELAPGGERAAPLQQKYRDEITYLEQFLPKRLGEAETRGLLQAAIAQTGAKSGKDSGKVMGAVMKTHKDSVDGALVKRLLDELLPG